MEVQVVKTKEHFCSYNLKKTQQLSYKILKLNEYLFIYMTMLHGGLNVKDF